MRNLLTGAVLALTATLPAAAQDLRGPDAFSDIPEGEARAVALFEEIGKVLQHPRCVNCHPAGDTPLQGDAMEPHDPPVVRGGEAGFGAPGMRCTTCHGAENVAYYTGEPGSIPGHQPWHLAPIEMAWVGKSLGEICAQIKDSELNGGRTLAELHDHNATDGLVGWGWEPGEGRTPAPGSQELFGQLTQAWIDNGAACPST